MPPDEVSTETRILQNIISELSELDKESQARIINTIATWFQIGGELTVGRSGESSSKSTTYNYASKPKIGGEIGFSDREQMTPKEFILDKQPRTEAERIACLAYFLTHYRDTKYFKTLDLSKLNTEAAQQKLSNPAHAVRNATRNGWLAPVKRGLKQLSAIGEQYVQVLPDRDLAKEISQQLQPKRKKKPQRKNRNKE